MALAPSKEAKAENVVAFKEDVARVEEKLDALASLVREQTTIIKRLIQGYRK